MGNRVALGTKVRARGVKGDHAFRVRLVGRVKKWENKKYLVFLLMYLVGRMEKLEGGKFFCLVEKKIRMIENVVYINLLLYPYYIIGKK